MDLSELDFDLPAESIAQRPLSERDASRMLLLDRTSGAWRDEKFRNLPDLLRGDELVVINNARVIPARLFGHRLGVHADTHEKFSAQKTAAAEKLLPAKIEVLLVRPLDGERWEALVRPGRKIPVGERIVFGEGELEARVEGRGGFGLRVLRFTAKGDFQAAIARLGHIPLPPYIKREDDSGDRERYQTVYAQEGRAVAAPTAGLHFTPQILDRLRKRGADIAEITLEVGLGTFEPVRTERLEDHKIHAESYEIPEATAEAIERARREKRPVLAVGTTVVRALEDAAAKSARGAPSVPAGKFDADIFIYPGWKFRVVNQLLTNFHLPRSSLLAMIAAFAGRQQVLAAYGHALEGGYRFYSYGDCMLIR
ncbi:MAG TPA: tRNA preQ1(34) S-adenosylmethionine ribosyltransferase-isomerase QueA [Candidatus Acidoferrales bacterium]|jgi:S-adenosylmethionine:tRNA ribosyltransferase-isomerase